MRRASTFGLHAGHQFHGRAHIFDHEGLTAAKILMAEDAASRKDWLKMLPSYKEEHKTFRMWATAVIMGEQVERLLGILIVCNLLVIVWETDARAMIRRAESEDMATSAHTQIMIIGVINHLFLLIYVAECALRLSLLHRKFFVSSWNCLDMFLVGTGLLEFVMQFFANSDSASLLRGLRMIRLLRLSRTLVAFRELHALICGLTNCMKTLFWASGLIFLTLTVWSIITVEYISPLMVAIDYGSCSWCPDAFQTVMMSNLSFFQIISGDGWSTLCRPIIDKNYWTAIVFIMVIIVVVFGLLNLVIAAIVDTAAQAREADVESMAQYANEAREEAWTIFLDLCQQLDTDNSGSIALGELRDGLKTNSTLRDYFSVMDIEEEDVNELFELLDSDGSEDLNYKEFHKQLYKMKTLELKTQLYCCTRYIQKISDTLLEQSANLTAVCKAMEVKTVEDKVRLREEEKVAEAQRQTEFLFGLTESEKAALEEGSSARTSRQDDDSETGEVEAPVCAERQKLRTPVPSEPDNDEALDHLKGEIVASKAGGLANTPSCFVVSAQSSCLKEREELVGATANATFASLVKRSSPTRSSTAALGTPEVDSMQALDFAPSKLASRDMFAINGTMEYCPNAAEKQKALGAVWALNGAEEHSV